MSKLSDWLRRCLEWIGHGYTVAQILGSLGAGQIVRVILVTRTQIAPIWITPLWLLSSAVAMALLVLVSRRLPKLQFMRPITQQITKSEAFQDVELFYRTYDNALMVEAENNIRVESDKYQPGADRERFLVRLLATAGVVYIFDQTWAHIFRSQIKLLEALNSRRRLTIDEVRMFYDEAAKNNPAAYAGFPFESWFGFLKAHLLIVPKDEGVAIAVYISVRGHEFLKYLIHNHRSADDRSL